MSEKPPAKAAPKKRATDAARSGRRARIAESLLADTSIADIARREGISREHASREAHAPETRILIASLLDRHYAAVESLVPEALRVIRDSFGAATYSVQKKTTKDLADKVSRDEIVVVEVGPDHYARLTGAKRLIELLTAGRPAPGKDEQQGNTHGILTLEDLQRLANPQPPLQ